MAKSQYVFFFNRAEERLNLLDAGEAIYVVTIRGLATAIALATRLAQPFGIEESGRSTYVACMEPELNGSKGGDMIQDRYQVGTFLTPREEKSYLSANSEVLAPPSIVVTLKPEGAPPKLPRDGYRFERDHSCRRSGRRGHSNPHQFRSKTRVIRLPEMPCNCDSAPRYIEIIAPSTETVSIDWTIECMTCHLEMAVKLILTHPPTISECGYCTADKREMARIRTVVTTWRNSEKNLVKALAFRHAIIEMAMDHPKITPAILQKMRVDIKADYPEFDPTTVSDFGALVENSRQILNSEMMKLAVDVYIEGEYSLAEIPTLVSIPTILPEWLRRQIVGPLAQMAVQTKSYRLSEVAMSLAQKPISKELARAWRQARAVMVPNSNLITVHLMGYAKCLKRIPPPESIRAPAIRRFSEETILNLDLEVKVEVKIDVVPVRASAAFLRAHFAGPILVESTVRRPKKPRINCPPGFSPTRHKVPSAVWSAMCEFGAWVQWTHDLSVGGN